jgi:tetratricopeptide (TPR) repeat protein
MQKVSLSPEDLIIKSRYAEAIELLIPREKKNRNSPCDQCYDLYCLTRCSLYMGWYKQAYAFAKHQIRIMKRERQQGSLLYVGALNECAYALWGMGKAMESKPYTLECIERIKALQAEDSLQYAQVFFTASHVGIQYKNWQAAYEGFERAKEILYAIPFKGQPDYVETYTGVLTAMAYCLAKLERSSEAYIWYQIALSETARMVGKEHASYGMALHAIASFYCSIRNPYLGIHTYEKAIVIYRKIYGLEHIMTERLMKETKQTLDCLKKHICAFCKEPRYRCKEECFNQRWMLFKRDCLECMVCREKFGQLNQSYWGGLYCDKLECKELFE